MGPRRGGDAGTAISVRALSITGGAVDFRSLQPGADRHVLVDDIGVRAALALAGNDITANASVTARGGQVDVSGRLDTAAMRGQVRVDARLPGARLTADGGIDGDDIRAQAVVDATDLATAARQPEARRHNATGRDRWQRAGQRRRHRHAYGAVSCA